MKAAPLKKVETCKFCLDYKGDPKPIQPEQMQHARRIPITANTTRLKSDIKGV